MSEIKPLPRADSGEKFGPSITDRTTEFNEDLNKRPKSKNSILNFMMNPDKTKYRTYKPPRSPPHSNPEE